MSKLYVLRLVTWLCAYAVYIVSAQAGEDMLLRISGTRYFLSIIHFQTSNHLQTSITTLDLRGVLSKDNVPTSPVSVCEIDFSGNKQKTILIDSQRIDEIPIEIEGFQSPLYTPAVSQLKNLMATHHVDQCPMLTIQGKLIFGEIMHILVVPRGSGYIHDTSKPQPDKIILNTMLKCKETDSKEIVITPDIYFGPYIPSCAHEEQTLSDTLTEEERQPLLSGLVDKNISDAIIKHVPIHALETFTHFLKTESIHNSNVIEHADQTTYTKGGGPSF